MPLPNQTFSTIQDLIAYINTFIIPNGVEEITGTIHNNVENSLANFIVSYTLNSGFVKIESSTGIVVQLSKPISYFTAVPVSLQWPNNVQNEYYIINANDAIIPFSNGFSFIDAYQNIITEIQPHTAIHLAKSANGSWVNVNNLPGTGLLPSQVGHEGEFLRTDGVNLNWFSPCLFIDSADFQPDGVTYNNVNIKKNKLLIFWNELNRFIYDSEQNSLQIEWQYQTNGGFKILIPGFNASTQDVHLYLFIKGLNS